MIAFTKMLTGKATVSKHLTYKGDGLSREFREISQKPIPVVVWNSTLRCNLKCVHCYANAGRSVKELSTDEAKEMINDFAEIGVPVLLLSGGEPLLREDIFELAEYAVERGIPCSLSTNGTLITEEVAERLKNAGFSYVGVSIDGMEKTNDMFRGVRGAFEKALNGLINARDAGMMTGIRFTVTKYNLKDVPAVIDLLAEKDIQRFCLYHLVPSGRAGFDQDISNDERRTLIDWLISKALELYDSGYVTEILTVDNPADGVYLHLKLKECGEEDKAEKVLEFLRFRGGDNSGNRIACVDAEGYVHPNQFWWDYTCGNVKETPLSKIWLNPRDELLIKLRNKTKYLRGRCGKCKFKEWCGGFRLRALRAGDLWGSDPSCYLRDDEIC